MGNASTPILIQLVWVLIAVGLAGLARFSRGPEHAMATP
jgi:hypothetical protein